MVREEALLIVGLTIAAVLTTVVIARTLGRVIARHRVWLAILLSGAAVPLFGIATTLALDARAAGDPPALAMAGTFILAGLASPITLLTSALALRRRGPTPR